MRDQDAIQRLKNGDLSGLEILIANHQIKALRTAYLIVQEVPLAEDIVQDTFLRIYQNIHRFDAEAPFEPYLLRSVVNSALNILERRSKEVSLEGNDHLESVSGLLSQAASVESEVEYAELKGQIAAAIALLSPRQRAVIVQRYYLGMNEKDMASVLDIAPGTVKWLLNAGRKRLRNLLGSQRSAK
jgi:RNA polymerase sigma-70 factor (ECF subfamily)